MTFRLRDVTHETDLFLEEIMYKRIKKIETRKTGLEACTNES